MEKSIQILSIATVICTGMCIHNPEPDPQVKGVAEKSSSDIALNTLHPSLAQTTLLDNGKTLEEPLPEITRVKRSSRKAKHPKRKHRKSKKKKNSKSKHRKIWAPWTHASGSSSGSAGRPGRFG